VQAIGQSYRKLNRAAVAGSRCLIHIFIHCISSLYGPIHFTPWRPVCPAIEWSSSKASG
jgi:hypothetical protein